MNNSYVWAMSDCLLYEGFEWLKNVDGFYAMSINGKSPIGYIFEVDLEHPDELHESHNDYPLAREKLAITCKYLAIPWSAVRLL